MTTEEEIARVIARKLGHNDDAGMHWERYLLAARGILAEYLVVKRNDHQWPRCVSVM